jgi:hypothetical protein
MKSYAFVYSRTKNHDYRLLAGLSEQFCPSSVSKVFENRAHGLVQTNEGLGQPQWLLVKEKGFILYGMACMNRDLDETYSMDKNPRPIRCFVGMALTDYDGAPIPNEMAIFKMVFRIVMSPIFESYTQKNLKDVVVDVSNASSFIYPQPFITSLNTDYHKCRLFSTNVDANALVASCLSCQHDISIATNVALRKSVLTPLFNPLMNAVMRECLSSEIEDVVVRHMCSSCGEDKDDFKEGVCLDCYEKLHPKCQNCGRETKDLEQGLCNNCRRVQSVKGENNPIQYCEHCGNGSYHLQDGLCEKCLMDLAEEQKKLKRKKYYIFSGFIILFFLIAIGLKKCDNNPFQRFYLKSDPERIQPNNIEKPHYNGFSSEQDSVFQIVNY